MNMRHTIFFLIWFSSLLNNLIGKNIVHMKNLSIAFLVFVCSVLSHRSNCQDNSEALFNDYRMLFSNSPTLNDSLNESRSRIAYLNPLFVENNIDMSGKILLNLFGDTHYPLRLEPKKGTFWEGLKVWIGRVEDVRFDHLPHYINAVVVVNPKTSVLVANVLTDKGYFHILPTGIKNEYRILDYKDEPFDCTALTIDDAQTHNLVAPRTVCGNPCLDETDENGNYVIDVFMGYSTSAAAVAGDINAHALSMIETVNMGLSNSLVTTTYLRLVGTGTTPNNPGIITSVLNDCYVWFASEIEFYAPDLIGVFQTSTGAPGEALGWAGIGGYSSVNDVNPMYPTVFRHEVGHNAGGGHCPGGNGLFPYAHGYDNGNWTTHLCGNGENFYSNPNVNDDLGNPIGDAATADMARVWEERSPIICKKGLHRVEYYPGDPCVNQICIPVHSGNQNELIKRIVFNTIDNNQSNPGWNCASITGYSDYTNISTTVNSGSTYTITITPNFSFPDSKVGVWIDWNNDGLLDVSERVANFSGNGPWSQSILVPVDAYMGAVRMRIRLQYGSSYSPHPCNPSGFTSGETEDYTVIISSPLPIILIDFQGKLTEKGNLLTWQTSTEINASHFEIEYNNSGINFEKAGERKAQGKPANYFFLHNQIFEETYHYRLKTVDMDGSYQYSNVISIPNSSEQNSFFLFPNPSSGQLTIRNYNYAKYNTQIYFINLVGQTVLETPVEVVNNEFVVNINMLPLGIYTCVITSNGNLVHTDRIIRY